MSHNTSGSRVRALAHRGAPAAGCGENTVAAVAGALRRGADGVEIDVRLTADDELVCSHEAVVRDRSGALLDVATSTSADLLGLVPSLAQVLAAVQRPAGTRIVVEAKPVSDLAVAVRTACTLADVLGAAAGNADVTVSSFDPTLLALIRGTCSDLAVRTALLGEKADDPTAILRRAYADGHDEVHLPLVGVRRSPRVVELAHSLGLPVAVWTVNDREDLRWLAGLGVDAVVTDDVLTSRSELGRAVRADARETVPTAA
jgi:glycerophosphoryl diester phosphodiesterase